MMNFNWRILAPEFSILITAAVVMIVDLFLKRGRHLVIAMLSFIGIMVAMTFSFENFSIFAIGFNNIVINDPISFYFKVIFCLGTLLTLFLSYSYVENEMRGIGEYYFLILVATFGMMVMATSLDLMTMFLGLEVMSIPLYVLAGIHRDRPRAREASMKYFLLGAFASGFLLYGIALIFGAFGSTNLIVIAKRLEIVLISNRLLVMAGFAMILIGLAFKIAAAPFHMWVPDVYEGAAMPITAFMSAGPKAAAFVALLRFASIFFPTMNSTIGNIFWVLAAVTMTWGNILAISQQNIKRMLAYSSIAHAGYVLVAIAAGSEAGFSAATFYLLAYTLMNIGAFAIIIYFASSAEKNENIKDFAGLGLRHPLLGLSLTIFLLSLTGIPGTAGFMGKYKIFIAAIDSGLFWLAIIGVINSLISVWYYFGVVVTMFMKSPDREISPDSQFTPSLGVVVIVALVGTIQLGIYPDIWLRLADLAAGYLNWNILSIIF